MNKKQCIGLIVAGCVFIVVCTASMIIKGFFGNVYGDILGNNSLEKEIHTKRYIKVIKIEGEISDNNTSSFMNSTQYNHEKIMEDIDSCADDSQNRGLLLYIDSPGGLASTSDELYHKLMTFKDKTGRPIWAYMSDMACSGAYYVAMSADKIYASRNTVTGSIGVIMQTYDYSGLLKKIGVSVNYVKSGKNKDMSYPTKPLTKEQKKIYQASINESYEQFIDVINKGRKNLSKEQIRKIADGRTYTPKQALANKLIDGIMYYEEAKDRISNEVGSSIEIYEEKNKESIFSLIKKMSIFNNDKNTQEKSDEKMLLEYLQNKNKKGVYYEYQG